MARRPKLVLKGRKGSAWERDLPLVFEFVGGERPYLWVGRLDDRDEERYVASLSPAMARQLTRFLEKNCGE